MAHADRKIKVTTKGTTNWKKTPKHYPAETVSYDYPRDSTALTNKARNDAATQYKAFLRTKIADEREMLYLELTQTHRIIG
jgi:hypothetical protein